MENEVETRLKKLVTNSNEVLEFRLIRDLEDLNSDKTIFKPEMTYQVFGNREIIFGYSNLKIKLFYAAGCLETYLGVNYTEKANVKTDGVEPDEIVQKIVKKLAPDVHYSYTDFMRSLTKDDMFVPYGQLIDSFVIDDAGTKRRFVTYKANMSYNGFKQYHQRIQTFLLWYIDAALFIDLDDNQWEYFNIFEAYTTTTGTSRFATVGFATVYQYYAYPEHIRPRIAQFLILPPFQKLSIGAHLLQAIYREYIAKKNVTDITVESPSLIFQRLRNYVDVINCNTLPSFKPENLKQGFNDVMVAEAKNKFKINKKQARIVYEILRLRATNIADAVEYQEYRIDVKRRLNVPFKRKQNEEQKIKRALKNVDKKTYDNGLPSMEQRKELLHKEYQEIEEEYKIVIQRLKYGSELPALIN